MSCLTADRGFYSWQAWDTATATGAALLWRAPTQLELPIVRVLSDGTYHTALIKPWPTRSLIPDGFTVADFTVDEAAGTATCPARVTRPITTNRRVTFGAVCLGCTLRAH